MLFIAKDENRAERRNPEERLLISILWALFKHH